MLSNLTVDKNIVRKIKFQTKCFEECEFFDVEFVDYHDAVNKVKTFIYKNDKVDYLKKPSVTFEDDKENYLSLEFDTSRDLLINYYSSQKKKTYSITLSSLENGFRYIELFYSNSDFSLDGFERRFYFNSKIRNKFKTSEFKYFIEEKSTIKYLIKTNWFSILLFIATSFYLVVVILTGKLSTHGALFFMFLFFVLIIPGLIFSYHLHYYRYSRDKVLIMSKGNDAFHYGEYSNLRCYNKKDIKEYIIYESIKYRNNFLSQFGFIDIQFTDGSNIIIPNTLISIEKMTTKLAGYKATFCSNVPFPIPDNH